MDARNRLLLIRRERVIDVVRFPSSKPARMLIFSERQVTRALQRVGQLLTYYRTHFGHSEPWSIKQADLQHWDPFHRRMRLLAVIRPSRRMPGRASRQLAGAALPYMTRRN